LIAYLKGILAEKTPTYIVIECSGVGYFVHISLNTYSKLGADINCKVFTHLAIKEDSHTLYGFIDEQERALFRHLISVSGVGTGTARMMLSSSSPEELRQAILNGDVARLQSIKGIGGKTAQRIVIDLRDKMIKVSDENSPLISLASNNTIREEALSALITLGFAKNIIEKALDKIIKTNEDITVEKLIKSALKNL
jgi:Holliday junction DNA helicase RuvA